MKKLIYFFLAATLFVGCKSSKDDDPTPEVNTEVTLPNLDNKAGGVYYGTTLDAKHVFKLVLKNGDDKMICQLFDGENYSYLEGENTNWKVGESLNNYSFTKKDGLSISINLTVTGSCTAYLNLPDTDVSSECKVLKSTKKEPCMLYSGQNKTDENGRVFPLNDVVLLIQGQNYFYTFYNPSVEEINYTYKPIVKWTATNITILKPFNMEYERFEEWEYTYSEDLLSFYLYDDEYPDEILTVNEKLYRRFN